MSSFHETKYTDEGYRLITKAEGLFGAVNSPYIFQGVKFYGTTPQIYYTPPPNGITIYLTPTVVASQLQGYFQLSHEVIHVLSPTPKPTASNIEEGLACLYSAIVMQEMFSVEGSIYANQGIFSTAYKIPYLKVLSIFNTDKNFFRNLREVNPFLSSLKMEDFEKVSHRLNTEEINYLISPMSY